MKLTFRLGNELALGNKFDLEFYGNCNQIVGESATGKTYIVGALQDAIYYYRQGIRKQIESLNDGKIEIINIDTSPTLFKALESYKGYVICIDNADHILCDYPQLREIIDDDIYNYYLLIGRGDLGVYIEPMSTFVVKSTPQPDGTFLFTLAQEVY